MAGESAVRLNLHRAAIRRTDHGYPRHGQGSLSAGRESRIGRDQLVRPIGRPLRLVSLDHVAAIQAASG